MKKTMTLLIGTFITSSLMAHAPFLAPLTYVTDAAQTTVITSYTEKTLVPEYAVKSLKQLQVISPNQTLSDIDLTAIKSANVADVILKDQGTYTLSGQITTDLNYTRINDEWKKYYTFDVKTPMNEREFVVAGDFDTPPELVTVKNHKFISSYLTKSTPSPVAHFNDNPIQVAFSTHPTELKVNQTIRLQIKKHGQGLPQALIEVNAHGQAHEQAVEYRTDQNGHVNLNFTKAGQYSIEIQENIDKTQTPTDRYTSIISVNVTAP